MNALPSGPLTESERVLHVFGVRVNNTRGEAALRKIRGFINRRDRSRAREVFFTNVHSIQLARRDSTFRGCLNQADLVLPDGAGVHLWGKLVGTPIIENLNGTDFTPRLLRDAESLGWSIYLLGARADVVEACRSRLLERFPRLAITGMHDGHFSPGEEAHVLEEINRARPSILLVALGSPLQEEWIVRHARQLNVGVCLAVGGLFDFLSGVRRRAPSWMRKSRIEWLYRFLQDPVQKWKRVFVEIPAFLLSVAIIRLAVSRVDPFVQRQGFLS